MEKKFNWIKPDEDSEKIKPIAEKAMEKLDKQEDSPTLRAFGPDVAQSIKDQYPPTNDDTLANDVAVHTLLKPEELAHAAYLENEATKTLEQQRKFMEDEAAKMRSADEDYERVKDLRHEIEGMHREALNNPKYQTPDGQQSIMNQILTAEAEIVEITGMPIDDTGKYMEEYARLDTLHKARESVYEPKDFSQN